MEMLTATHLLLEQPEAPMAIFIAVDPQLIISAIVNSGGVANKVPLRAENIVCDRCSRSISALLENPLVELMIGAFLFRSGCPALAIKTEICHTMTTCFKQVSLECRSGKLGYLELHSR